jgi:hypothetical protein
LTYHIRSYLADRYQRVVIEGQSSQWIKIVAGVPQGSVLGPLLFLLYINDITDSLSTKCFLYADDTSLFDIVENPLQSAVKLNNDLRNIDDWSNRWQVIMNADKTKSIIFSVKNIKPFHPPLIINGNTIEDIDKHTHLGLTLSSNMSWREHILNIHQKASKRVHMLKGLKYKLNRDILINLYKTMIRPVMEYADCVWDGCSVYLSNLLEILQYESAIIVTGALKGSSKQRLLSELCWEEMKTRRLFHKLTLFYKIVKGYTPSYLRSLLPPKVCEMSRFSLRSGNNFSLFKVRTERMKNSFFPSNVLAWNSLDESVRNIDSLSLFKRKVLYLNYPHVYNKIFNISLTRYASVLHTRLRLGYCALNFYLFRINRSPSQEC